MTNSLRVAIIGGGFVGSATYLLNCDSVKCIVYDLDRSRCIPSDVTYEDVLKTEFAFICVPTPMRRDRSDGTQSVKRDGSCQTNVVQKAIQSLQQHNYTGTIIVRSTVPVGFCAQHNVKFMPEFLTEANWKNDFITCKEWIIGGNYCGRLESIFKLAAKCGAIQSSQVLFCSTQEAEMVKYFKNCFLATKVSFCNEIKQFCDAKGVDYSIVRDLAVLDSRIGASHTRVPGPDGKSGFSGTCFPKDMNSLKSQISECGQNPYIIGAAIERNEMIDRPDKDWLGGEYKNRAFDDEKTDF